MPELETEGGSRARYVQTIGVFEDMHRALKARVAETRERRALECLDTAFALVAQFDHKRGELDVTGFSAFRDSVESLLGRSPEARALELFQGAFKELIAAGGEFDDLPDHDKDEDEEEAIEPDAGDEDADEASDDEIAETAEEAAEPHAAVGETQAHDEAESAEPDTIEAEASDPDAETEPATEIATEAAAPDYDEVVSEPGVDGEDQDGAAAVDEPMVEAGSETKVDVHARIAELESELAAARAHLAA
jgi:hypothetical protein